MQYFVGVMAFVAMALVTGQLAMCEPLRKIQGSSFPMVWLFFLLVLLGITILVMAKVAAKRRDALKEKINNFIITHTEIPHLLKFKFNCVNSGYYLLRLYLQGIVRFSCKREKNAEGVVVDTSCLTLDEARLDAIKAQGGRHSLAAINMVRYIRVNQSCSISKVLSSGFADDKDHYEIRAELQKETESGRMITGFVLAAVMGFAYGLLVAKYRLGIANYKNVGILSGMLFFALMIAPFLWG